jgi:D-alanine transaminase/branched-chain amino acid aminotransferase
MQLLNPLMFFKMNDNFTCINGEYVPFSQSALPVSDLIIQRGYGIFDFFLVRDHVPTYLSLHLDRFILSASILGLGLPYTKEELTEMVLKLIAKNDILNSSIKIMLSGGLSADDFTLAPEKSTLVIINKPFEIRWPEAWKSGATLITCNYQREMPEAKTINYLRSVSLSRKLLETSAAELLYLDRNWVRECSRSNVYLVKDNIILTPKSKILQGVTRRRILDTRGFEVVEADFKFKDLLNADEVFITSTTKGVLPIVKVDSKIIADGKIGPVSREIQKIIMP